MKRVFRAQEWDIMFGPECVRMTALDRVGQGGTEQRQTGTEMAEKGQTGQGETGPGKATWCRTVPGMTGPDGQDRARQERAGQMG